MLDVPDQLQTPAGDEKEPEEIRADMVETRAALTDKLQTLECTVKETFENVKRTVDPRHHMREHPWLTLGSALLTGFILGKLTPQTSKKNVWPPPRSNLSGLTGNGASSTASIESLTSEREAKPGLFHRLAQQFGEELELLESAAITAGVGIARDWAKESLPRFAPDIDKVADRVIAKVSNSRAHLS